MNRTANKLIVGALGICFVACGHRIIGLCRADELLDPYCKEGEGAIVLMLFVVAALAWFINRLSRPQERPRRYGHKIHPAHSAHHSVSRSEPKSIYDRSEPLTHRQPWCANRAGRSAGKSGTAARNFSWITAVQFSAAVLSCIYFFFFTHAVVSRETVGVGGEFRVALVGIILVISLLATAGLIWRKRWGINVGYASSTLQLLWFPLGTLFGMIFLFLLIEAAPFLATASRRQVATE